MNYHQKYYLENKIIINKRCREYYLKNKKKFYEYQKKRYIKHRRKIKNYFDKWRRENREYFNILMNRNYYNNKQKYFSRNKTSHYKDYIKNNFCQNCGKKRDIQIHHEIYPTKTKEIIKAIEYNQVYYLCRNCHLHIHGKKRVINRLRV